MPSPARRLPEPADRRRDGGPARPPPARGCRRHGRARAGCGRRRCAPRRLRGRPPARPPRGPATRRPGGRRRRASAARRPPAAVGASDFSNCAAIQNVWPSSEWSRATISGRPDESSQARRKARPASSERSDEDAAATPRRHAAQAAAAGTAAATRRSSWSQAAGVSPCEVRVRSWSARTAAGSAGRTVISQPASPRVRSASSPPRRTRSVTSSRGAASYSIHSSSRGSARAPPPLAERHDSTTSPASMPAAAASPHGSTSSTRRPGVLSSLFPPQPDPKHTETTRRILQKRLRVSFEINAPF